MEIVTPKLADVPALLGLWRKQYEYHHDVDSVYYVPYTEELRDKFEKYVTAAIVEGVPHILIAKENAALTGFITFTEDEETYFDTKIKRFGVVIELYVSDESRGRGVGKSLMEVAENSFRSKGLLDIKLSCSSLNMDTLDFYEHIGYTNRQTILFKQLQ